MTPNQTMPDQQGNGKSIVNRLTSDEPMTAGYQPTMPAWTFWNPDGTPILFIMRDIELMMTHPVVHQGLEYYKSGIASAEFDVKCENSEVGQFVLDQCQRFWDKGVGKVQNGYEYGWLGGENLYSTDEGPIKWDCILDFAPRDAFLLTRKSDPVGVRIKNIRGNNLDSGQVDLWANTDNIPAKGFWYSHRPRYGQYYGRSQLMAAWRPWKRLAFKDGLESTLDGAIYRFAYSGPTIRYPPEDIQAPQGSQRTTTDSQGRPRIFARDFAKQMGEWLKTGASVALSSEKWPNDQGGHYKWEVEWPDHVLNVDPLLNAAKWLQDQIYFGIGVPPELIQAQETGSGYSGRAIPMESFMLQQQRIADHLLDCFVEQVLRPLVMLNFGPVKFEAKVKNLLQTKKQQTEGKESETAPEGGQMPGQEQPGQAAQPTEGATPGLPSGIPGVPGSRLGMHQAPIIPLSLATTELGREIIRKILNPPSAFLGLVGDEWHGPKPPGKGWVEIEPGPRGGKRWKKGGKKESAKKASAKKEAKPEAASYSPPTGPVISKGSGHVETGRQTPDQKKQLDDLFNELRKSGVDPNRAWAAQNTHDPFNLMKKPAPPQIESALKKAIPQAVADYKKKNAFGRLTIKDVYEHFKPPVSIREFQGILARMQNDGTIRLSPYTQAFITHSDPKYLMPLDSEAKWYLDEGRNAPKVGPSHPQETKATAPAPPAPAPPAPAPPAQSQMEQKVTQGILSRLIGWFKRLLGGGMSLSLEEREELQQLIEELESRE